MFLNTKNEYELRKNEILSIIQLLNNAEVDFKKSGIIQPPFSSETDIHSLKGLCFVYMYGLGEYVFKEIVRETLQAINSEQVPIKNLKYHTLSLILWDEWPKLYLPLNKQKDWLKRIEFAKKLRSSDAPLMNFDATPLLDGNIKSEHFLDFARIFGISEKVMFKGKNTEFRGRWDHIVRQRQLVSHGEEKASTCGGRLSTAELKTYFTVTNSFIDHLFVVIQNYVSKKHYRGR